MPFHVCERLWCCAKLQKHVDKGPFHCRRGVKSVPVLTACIRTAIYIEVSYQPLATGDDERLPLPEPYT